MIDWSLAPEGADSIKANPANVLRWFKGNLKYVETGGFVDGFNNNSEWKTVATRPAPTQPKTVADAVEQEGEKWTHTIDGLKVRFLVDGPDEAGEVPVVADDGYYRIFDVDQLKPIKPMISEAEVWRKVQDGHPAGFIMEKYNVVEKD